MSQIILLVIAIYAIMVGYHNKASALFSQLGSDLPKFAPWIIAIVILGILAVNKETEKLGKPMLALIAVGIILRDWSRIQSTAQTFYKDVIS